MSIVISLQSFVDAFCLTICQKCRDENSSGDCNYNDNYIALIISIFPYILRFAQCVNRYRDCPKKFYDTILYNTMHYTNTILKFLKIRII